MSHEVPSQGVLLRHTRGKYVTMPQVLAPNLVATVQRLNVAVAFTMSTHVTDLMFSIFAPNQTELVLPHDSTQYQILESFDEMAKATSNKIKRFQYTCFVRTERVLLLWDDDVEGILTHAASIERQLLTVVSGNGRKARLHQADTLRSGEPNFHCSQALAAITICQPVEILQLILFILHPQVETLPPMRPRRKWW